LARMGEKTGLWWENEKEGDHVVCLGVSDRIILKYIFKTQDARAWTFLI
jgi:hypothetical protein